MKRNFSIQAHLGYAIAGSIFLHITLVSLSANLLSSEELDSPPIIKKLKIEMVTKKPKPIRRVAVKENKIVKQSSAAPMQIKKPHTPLSAQKIRKKDIAIQPVASMVAMRPKGIREEKVDPIKKPLQMAKADIFSPAAVQEPQRVEKLNIQENRSAKVQWSLEKAAKPPDVSPLPRPVENIRAFSKVSGKEARFHDSAAGLVQSHSTPKSVPVSSTLQNEGKAATLIDQNRKVVSPRLPQARAVAVTQIQVGDKIKAAEFKRGVPSRSQGVPNMQKRVVPAANGLKIANGTAVRMHNKTITKSTALVSARSFAPESVTKPKNAAEFYEQKIHAVSTVPSARASINTPSSNRVAASDSKMNIVQKGELFTATTISNPRPVPGIFDQRALDGYLETLQASIASSKRYPESARKEGREGQVTLQFMVLKSGAVKNIQLVSKTNYPELNEEAMEAVRRAAPFSELPDEIGKPFLNIVLPFKFQLKE